MTVSLATARARVGAGVTVSLVLRRENVYDPASEKQSSRADPYPVGTGPGEVQTTRRTWMLQSDADAAVCVEVAEGDAELDADVEARLRAAGDACRTEVSDRVKRGARDDEAKP